MTHPHEREFPEIRAWLQREAAAKSIDEIHGYVTERFDRLAHAAAAIPASRLGERPPGEEWSAIEALKHVVEWNWQCGEDILHVSLSGERPGNPLPDFQPDRDVLLARNSESLASVYSHVTAADPGAFLDVTWEHPFFGQLNWREWFLFLGVHATDHTGQINGIREALGG